MSRVLRLVAENFKRLRAVDITPENDLVVLRGANGEGKSSVLDAIWAALGGARDAVPARPIRTGADRASIRVELDDLIVTRRFAGDNTHLVVEARDTGARYPSPQAVLDRLVGAVAFDPMQFCRLPAREQLATLRGLVPLDVDVAALDAASRADYERRTELNRDAARLRAQAQGIVLPDPLPEPVDVDALLAEQARLFEHNRSVEAERNRRAELGRQQESLDRLMTVNQRRAAELREEAARLTKRAEELDREVASQEIQIREIAADLERAGPVPAVADLRDVGDRIRAAQATNAAAERVKAHIGLLANAKVAEDASAELTAAIAGREETKRAALARAEFPVPGLGFGEDGVLLNDVPFEQASQAEKVRVSVALAMAANPRLRVICVRDGSLLDGASTRLLTELARERDFQLWLEVTDDAATTGVIIEDGAVRTPVPEPVGFEEVAE